MIPGFNRTAIMIKHMLQRVTSGGEYLPVIDGLRCVAILAVVMFHLEDYVVHKHFHLDKSEYSTTWVHRILHTGGCGVPLFFTISGFILGLPFIEARMGSRPPVRLSSYYLRRITRLEPPYLANLCIMTVLLCLVKGIPWQELVPHFVASALYVHGLYYGTMSTINFVAWSLEVEAQFYILAPLIAGILFAPSRSPRRIAVVLLLGLLIAAKFVSGGQIVRSWPACILNHLDQFVMGFLLADIFACDWQGCPSSRILGDVWAVIGWAGVLLTQLHSDWKVLLPIATGLAFWGTFQSRWIKAILTWSPITLTGGMCYTVYLYHFAILSALGRVLANYCNTEEYALSMLVHTATMVPLIWGVCAVLYIGLEKPFMGWRTYGWFQQNRSTCANSVSAKIA